MANINGALTKAENKRGREYTPKQRKFLKLFAQNNFTKPEDCAIKAGYKQHYWDVVHMLKEDIKEIAESILIGSAPSAASAVIEILNSTAPVPNAQTKLQAAKEVLDRTGVVRTERHEHDHQVSGGLFLLPVKHELIQEQGDDYIDGEFEESA